MSAPRPHTLAIDTMAVSSAGLLRSYGKWSGRTAIFHRMSLLGSSSQGSLTIDHAWWRLGTEICILQSSSPDCMPAWAICTYCFNQCVLSIRRHNSTIHLGSKIWSHRCVPIPVCHTDIDLPLTIHFFLDLPHSSAWKTDCRKMCLSQHPAGDPLSIPSSINGRNFVNEDKLLLLFVYITSGKMHTVETEYINLSVCSHIVKTFFSLHFLSVIPSQCE